MSGGFEELTVALSVEVPGQQYLIGTGVPVKRGIVLTARHVAVPDDAVASPVRVRFWHAQEPDFRPDPATGDTGYRDACVDPAGDADAQRGVIWSCDQLDLALLSVNHPPSVGVARLGSVEPYRNADWDAEGFPGSAWEHNDLVARRFSGKSHTRFPNQSRYQIDADVPHRSEDTRQNTEGWAGASGSALFVNGAVMGVLLARKPSGDDRVLSAVPIVDALKDPGFREKLGLPDISAAQFEAKLAAIMARIQPLSKARLAAELQVDPSSSDKDLAKALSAHDLETGFELLEGLGSGAYALDEATISALAMHLALCHSVPDNLALVQAEMQKPEPDVQTCAAGSYMGAEFLMAAAEARSPCFKSAQRDGPPEGTYCLPVPPETGAADQPDLMLPDVAGRLGADLLFVENELAGQIRTVVDLNTTTENRRKILKFELEHRAKKAQSNPSYYFVEGKDGAETESSRVAARARIKAIREEYPQLGVVYIDPDKSMDDLMRYRSLLDLLPKD